MFLCYTFYGPGSNLGEDKNFFIMIKNFLIKNLTIEYIHFVQLLFKENIISFIQYVPFNKKAI